MTDTLYAAVQRLEPGAKVRLFEIDFRPITGGGAGDVNYFHGYTQVGNIVWQGQQYQPWPIETEGFELTGGQQPTPKVQLGNIDNAIGILCDQLQDMLGAEVTVHDTYGQFLDGQPDADPTQEVANLWIIERKSRDTGDVIEFELSNPINVDGAMLPGRQILADVCGWIAIGGYRGPQCGYTGGPVADINDNLTSDPAADNCSGTLKACKMRFGANKPLPFGGFPAAGLIRS